MTRFISGTLKEGGLEPVLGYYEPYSLSPELSVPCHKLLQRKPGKEKKMTPDGLETHAIGAWLPELEFTHYKPTKAWLDLMDSCDRFVTASGNVLAARPYANTGRPFVAWVATGWEEDRVDRVAHFPLHRKLLDSLVNSPVLRQMEKSILKSGSILALSLYTRQVLNKICGENVTAGVLPAPVDTAFFVPAPDRVVRGRIGFSGRFDDPRKNIGLLLTALHRLRSEGVDVQALVTGGEPDAKLKKRLEYCDLDQHVTFAGYVSLDRLKELLQTLDVFVVPSHQEGLCIAALEAMACGCPVVSTRCGGPEEFVIDGETGYLVDSAPGQMAAAIRTTINNPNERDRMGSNARQLVKERYNTDRCKSIFWSAFQANNLLGENE